MNAGEILARARAAANRGVLRRGVALKQPRKTLLVQGAVAACTLVATAAHADPPKTPPEGSPPAASPSSSSSSSPASPQLAWDKPVRCMSTTEGKSVRVQCETKGEQTVCLVAPNQDTYGSDIGHTKECEGYEPPDAYGRLVAEGAKLIPAIAEAPPGYARAGTGRAYQVKFDLLNRVFLGASWVPTFQLTREDLLTPERMFGRGQAEMGIQISYLSHKGRSRHDIRILEGTATFADLELRGQLFSYDYQHLHRRPAFYLTSFFGKPRLYEVAPPLGWGFRLLRVNDRPPAFRDTLDMEFAEVHLAWNPWQSEDLYNHVRIEAGADIGKFWQDRDELKKGLGTGAWYAGFGAEAKFRAAIGDSGLHYVNLDLGYRRPTYLDGPKAGAGANDFTLKAAYEGIFVAINDQPLSFRVAAEGASREDPFSGVRNVELRATMGLRFSFWAPPRVFEPLPQFEDP